MEKANAAREAKMRTGVGLALTASTLLGFGAGCAHDRPRPKATIVAVGNADPNKVPRDPAHERMGFVRVSDTIALNHTPAAWEREDKYGQPNMAEPNAYPVPKKAHVARTDSCDQTIYFESGSAELSPRAETALREAARCMASDKGGRATIVGRTDPSGSSARNLTLGAERANAVAEYLESLGVSKRELNRTSLGETGASADEARWPREHKARIERDEP